jgi:hypothetical protein
MFLFVTKEVPKRSMPHIYHIIPFMDRQNDALEDIAANSIYFLQFIWLPNKVVLS